MPGRPQDSQCITALTLEYFDILASLLDVSPRNAAELFTRITGAISTTNTIAQLAKSDLGLKVEEEIELELVKELHIEDFTEQLLLWTDNPLTLGGNGSGPSFAAQNVQQAVAPARAAISALKAELTPRKSFMPRPLGSEDLLPGKDITGGAHTARDPTPPSKDRNSRRPMPKIPWRAYYTKRETATMPMFVT